jgi:conjugal transfer pilus assembly protein TraL
MEVEMAHYLLPRTVDEPVQIFFWRLDEAILPILGLVLGAVFGYMLPLFLTGVAVSFVYMRLRIGMPEMYVIHLLYWHGFYPDRGHSFFDPFDREVQA